MPRPRRANSAVIATLRLCARAYRVLAAVFGGIAFLAVLAAGALQVELEERGGAL